MKAAIIAVGDELVLGQTLDSNSAWLSARLAELGIMTAFHKTVADDEQVCAEVFRESAELAGLVIVTGGLGPTDDDITRHALARAMGVSLVLDEVSLARISEFFKGIGREMPAQNIVQAMCPECAKPIENSCGTAPGIYAEISGTPVYVMPGVPHEMRAMYERSVLPSLRARSGRVILTRRLDTFGAGESTVAEKLGSLMGRDKMPLVGTTVERGIVSVRIRSESETFDNALEMLERVVAEVNMRLGDLVFGEEGVLLQESVAELLKKTNFTVVTVESCTGGLLSKKLTDIPGSSSYFLGGWVVYSNELKEKLLGIDPSIIKEFGAVSRETALAMAERGLE
ncbi:MAG: CinA family nicotinamide mononucleotide deamidase-related protein, partial [Lentisphaerae bacterium]|nr:CinA family nicotinamide mononucleotide deamidase-related protein [Lentisphaerota bacterium]